MTAPLSEATWVLLVVLGVLALWAWWFVSEIRNAPTVDEDGEDWP